MARKKSRSKKIYHGIFSGQIPQILILFVGIVILIAAFIVVGIYVGRTDYNLLPSINQSPGILFVMRGNTNVTRDRISFTNTKIEWFTDHPGRAAGKIEAHALYSYWDKIGFSSDPPNAAFADEDAVIELTDPQFTANSISFAYVIISGELNTGSSGIRSLYIDATGSPVNSQVTDSVTQANTISCTGYFDNINSNIILTIDTSKMAVDWTKDCTTMTKFLNIAYGERENNQLPPGWESLFDGSGIINDFGTVWDCNGVQGPSTTDIQVRGVCSPTDTGNYPEISFNINAV